MKVRMNLFTVKNTQLITPDTLLLTLQPKRNKDRLRFYPGQYASIGFKSNGRPSPMRCFSIVSSPNKPDEMQFAMRVYGDFTRSLAELENGNSVFVHGPFGNFVIDKQYDRNVILLAGGIGITPFMSMIRSAAETKLPTPITLLYSCRTQENIPFYEELLDLERQNPHFRVAFFVTKGGADKLTGRRVLTSRIEETRLTELTADQYNRFTYFVCGPKTFTKSMQTILARHKTSPERIITEEFTPTSQVNAISLTPKYSIARWTYGLTGASLVLGTAFIMTIDLARAVPKIVSAQAVSATSTSQNKTTPVTSSPTTSSSSSSNASSSSADSSSATTTSPTSSTTTKQPTSTQQTQTYQAPITAVS